MRDVGGFLLIFTSERFEAECFFDDTLGFGSGMSERGLMVHSDA